eukprot:10371974-Prorocentrum_lima.AAC.1
MSRMVEGLELLSGGCTTSDSLKAALGGGGDACGSLPAKLFPFWVSSPHRLLEGLPSLGQGPPHRNG